MKTFSALYRSGYPENKAERAILIEMNEANCDYEYYSPNNPKGLVRGNYLGDFMQKMALNIASPIIFITNLSVKKKRGLYLM